MTKPEVRELARRFGLDVADKHDSQDICFVPTGRYTDIIERLKPNAMEPGDIVHLDGRVLGRHEGITHYTVGQRRGLGIAPAQPLYVVRLDAATRRVVVGPREALRTTASRCATSTGSATARSIALSASGLEMFVQVRSTRAAAAGLAARRQRRLRGRTRRRRGGRLARTGLRVLRRAAGQARVLGGGFIQSADGDARRCHAAAARRSDARLASQRGAGAWGDIDRDRVKKAYGRWAPVYDLVFGKVFDAGPSIHHRGSRSHRRAHSRCRRRHRPLAVGFLALHRNLRRRYFRADAAQGAERVRAQNLTNVETLAVMDAKNLAFPDALLRCGGGAICHHRGARSRSDAR